MSDALIAYFAIGGAVAVISLLVFTFSMAVEDARTARQAARTAILSPAWPVIAAWWLLMLARLLWRIAAFNKHAI